MTAGGPEAGGAETPDAETWADTVVDAVAEEEVVDADASGSAGGADEADLADEVIEPDEILDPADDAGAADGAAGAADGPTLNGEAISVEDLVADLERVSTERDHYLDTSRRIQAEFENYKKQVAKRESEARERANDSLVGELLPVLDAFDGAVANGADDVAPMRSTILDALGKQGLERIDPVDDQFDPSLHEAVMHEDGDVADGPVVAEVMRAGYVWKGRVLRPAMVKTRG